MRWTSARSWASEAAFSPTSNPTTSIGSRHLTHHICLIFVSYLPHNCLIFASICPVFVSYLSRICLVFVSYFSHNCLIFASICLVFVSYLPGVNFSRLNGICSYLQGLSERMLKIKCEQLDLYSTKIDFLGHF